MVRHERGRGRLWYDALYRLVAETITEPGGSPETESFGYDAVGNRVFRATDAGVEPSTYDENDRLLDDGTATYTWDDQGNLRGKTVGAETTTYRWDGRDRLIEVSGPSTGLVQHVYDHAGDRVETLVDGVATKYLVDANRGLSQILEERSSSGSLVASYVHGDDGGVLARFDGAASIPSYYLHDAQQSVRHLATAGGAITDAYSYSAFGIARTPTGVTPNAYRYGGQWSDSSSGFYHLRARWMDPGSGRFLATDPFSGRATEPGSLHRYRYADANPANRSDPSGLFSGGLTEFSHAQKASAEIDAQQGAAALQLIRVARVAPEPIRVGEGIALWSFALWGGLRKGEPAPLEVIFDANLILSVSGFANALAELPPGALPVITYTVLAEANRISAAPQGPRIVPAALALKRVADAPNAVAMARLKAMLLQERENAERDPAFEGDLIIGATGASTFRPVYTNDRRFYGAMVRAFGPTASVWIPKD